jgi:hypothetical protein
MSDSTAGDSIFVRTPYPLPAQAGQISPKLLHVREEMLTLSTRWKRIHWQQLTFAVTRVDLILAQAATIDASLGGPIRED